MLDDTPPGTNSSGSDGTATQSGDDASGIDALPFAFKEKPTVKAAAIKDEPAWPTWVIKKVPAAIAGAGRWGATAMADGEPAAMAVSGGGEPVEMVGAVKNEPAWPPVAINEDSVEMSGTDGGEAAAMVDGEPGAVAGAMKQEPASPPAAIEKEPAWPHVPATSGWPSVAPIWSAGQAAAPVPPVVATNAVKAVSARRPARATSAALLGQHVAVSVERAMVHNSGCAEPPVWSVSGRVADSASPKERMRLLAGRSGRALLVNARPAAELNLIRPASKAVGRLAAPAVHTRPAARAAVAGSSADAATPAEVTPSVATAAEVAGNARVPRTRLDVPNAEDGESECLDEIQPV